MIVEYKIALLDFYKAQKESDKLSSELENPNRSRLKQEFIRLYRVKNNKLDTEIIRRFFDPEGKYDDQLDSISRIEIDKLRPLVGYLTLGTNLQADASVHALAWLLGFTPYAEWKKSHNPKGTQGTGLDIDTDSNKGQKSMALLQFYIFIGIVLVLLIASALLLNHMTTKGVDEPSIDQKCMYWNGSHYIPTECAEYPANRTILQLNKRVLKNFKKIRFSDLLTKKDIGKVWYAKIDGEHEFFTDSGSYPSDPNKKLKPLSAFILSNHISYHRFILQGLSWCGSLILLLYLVSLGIKKVFHEQSIRIKKV